MTAPIQTCYRHSDRRAGVTCQRCDRPICPQCMSQASVGFHCPECSRQGKQRVFTGPAVFGGGQPVVTQILIAINVVMYLATASNARFTADYELLGSAQVVFRGEVIPVPVGVAHGEWYRLITGGFLHANIVHIALNMFALWVLGSQLE